MDSKQVAKLAFGSPGFFDFLAPVTKALAPISSPLVSLSTQIGGKVLNAVTGSNAPSEVLARPEIQTLGQQLFGVGTLAGAGVVAGAVVAPALAGLSLPTAFSALGSQVQKLPSLVEDNILGSDNVAGSTQEEDAEDDPLGNDGDY